MWGRNTKWPPPNQGQNPQPRRVPRPGTGPKPSGPREDAPPSEPHQPGLFVDILKFLFPITQNVLKSRRTVLLVQFSQVTRETKLPGVFLDVASESPQNLFLKIPSPGWSVNRGRAASGAGPLKRPLQIQPKEASSRPARGKGRGGTLLVHAKQHPAGSRNLCFGTGWVSSSVGTESSPPAIPFALDNELPSAPPYTTFPVAACSPDTESENKPNFKIKIQMHGVCVCFSSYKGTRKTKISIRQSQVKGCATWGWSKKCHLVAEKLMYLLKQVKKFIVL